jgi:hypothetical protein
MSASKSLKLVDVAFSPHLKDESVMTLVQKSLKLERFNLRGCRGVSSECYNNTPIIIMQQRKVATVPLGGSNVGIQSKATANYKKRKGDNLFFFAHSMEEEKTTRLGKKKKKSQMQLKP